MTTRSLTIGVLTLALLPPATAVTAPGIQLSPSAADVRAGQKKTFTASLTGGVQVQNLVWELRSTANSFTGSLGAFDPATGIYTAPSLPPVPNTVVLQVKDSKDPAVTAKAAINVLNPIPATSGIEPSTINAGLPYKVVIKGTGFIPTSQLLWDGTAVTAAFDAVAGTLTVAGAKAPTAGKALLIVTNPDPGTRSSSAATLNITQVQVQASPDGRTVRTGGTLALSAKVLNNSDQTVAWSVQGGAPFGTIDEKGVYHAPSVLPTPATAVLTATSMADPSASAKLTVSLLNVVPVVTALDPPSINTGLAFTVTIKGTGIVDGATAQWGNATIASVFDAKTGFLTIKGTGPAEGTVPVTVTNPLSGGTPSNARTLSVLPPVAVTVSGNNRTVRCGATLQLAVKVQNNTDQTVTWQVTGGGSVDSANVYHAPAVLPDTTDVTITAKANADPKATASSVIHLVNPIPVVTSATPAALKVGATGFSLTGTGFAKTATVFFAGTKMVSTWNSDTSLTVTGAIPAIAGNMAAVKVMNPDPGSLVSAPVFVPVSMPGAKMTYTDAVRFLELASWGPSPESINRLMAIGRDAWLAEQFDSTRTGMTPYPEPQDASEGVSRLQNAFFTNALTGQDQLRQRVGFALSQILVVSAVKDTKYVQMSTYMNLLNTNAFGNFRTLLELVTKNASMGYFLDMVNNNKANPARNIVANENYARELLQLFTVGLVNLNLDGTATPTSTYDETTVKELAKVMTGWTYAPQPGFASRWTNPRYYFGPMVAFEDHHETAAKNIQFAGYTNAACNIPAGGTAQADLTSALDCIASHPNVAPFISYRLIQRLVTSSPSQKFVTDVATVFKTTNGDLRQVVTAILTHPEASAPSKLNEPVLYATRLLRSLNAAVTTSASGIRSQTAAMGQDVLTAPSVFNYFSPFFRVDGTVAPEFQIVNASTLLSRLNFVNRVVYNGLSSNVRIDFANWDDLASSPPTLIEAVNQALYRGNMTASEKSALTTAVGSKKSVRDIVRGVLYVAAAAPQYQVQQ